MDKVCKYGPIQQDMKVNGKMVKLTVKESIEMLKEITILENLLTIFDMVKVKRHLPMDHATRAHIKKARKMVKVHSVLQMEASTLACSSKTCCMAQVNTLGMMENFTLVNGSKTKCMGKES